MQVAEMVINLNTRENVCPTCGTCPTCGHRPSPMVSPWAVPPMLPYVAPQPYYPSHTAAPPPNHTWTVTYTCETAESSLAAA